jgi:two-component system phosphate regulon sensor histidine kinase PhoR
MKRKMVQIIIIGSSLALLGIVFTQVYWVKESFNLKEEQFANSVRIALKGVANQMLNYEMARLKNTPIADSMTNTLKLPEVASISAGLLDFKISEEFNCMHVGKDYAYGIIDTEQDKIIMGKYATYDEKLIYSEHNIPMTGFQEPDRYQLAAFFPNQSNLLLMRMINWLVLSVIFALLLILSFYFTIYFLFRQKRLSEMKSDFINNMTHEFKTPLATISLASEMLMKKNVNQDSCKTNRYARIIFEENSRLQVQVEQILNISSLERGEFKLKPQETDIHELISKVTNNFKLIIHERKGTLKKDLKATNPSIILDSMHISNVLSNLLDNANKYSPDPPEITVRTWNTDEGIMISVEDKGIGISHENQKQIFKNLYRVPTGNIHNVKGFGIGLFYVKTIVEAHGGEIKINSEPSVGSRFDVYLPFVSKSVYDEGE